MTAYAAIAERLRQEIADGRYGPGVSLPTEAELCVEHDVSRQTVRRAFHDLVAEGLVYRVPGRGTFVSGTAGKYIRSSGSIEELLALAIDTDLEIVDPPAIGIHIEAAGRLRLDSDDVIRMRFRRLHHDRPYCLTTAYLPVAVAAGLLAAPELRTSGVHRNLTVLSVVQRITGRELASADQTITAETATEEAAALLECAPGDPVLRIDRLYFDATGATVELAVNHFNPNRYTYRFQMRARHP